MNKIQKKKINSSSTYDTKKITNNEKQVNKNNEKPQNNVKTNSLDNQASSGVKIKVSNKLLEMEKNEEKLLQLQKIIQEQECIIKTLNQGVEPYNQKIENLNLKLTELQNENDILKKKEIKMNLDIENLKNKINEEIKIKNELIDGNKKLQQKIEILNQQIDDFKYENKKDQEEYNNMCKIKSNFEDKIIKLTEDLEKTIIKLQTAENVIKQKEKYIQMLVNKRNNSTFYNYNKNKEQGEQNNNINSKRSVRPQSFGIKNRNILKQGGKNIDIYSNENNGILMEQENIIKKLKEKISHLEKDNAGLLIRLKNNNNLKSIKK